MIVRRKPKIVVVALALMFGCYLLSLVIAAVLEIGAVTIDGLMGTRRPLPRAVGAALDLALVGTVAWPALRLTVQPVDNSNIKQALAIVSQEMRAGDRISVNAWAGGPFLVYRDQYPAGDLPVIEAAPDGRDPCAYAEALRPCGDGRLWIVYMHDLGAGAFFAALAAESDLEKAREGPGAALYALDLASLEAGAGEGCE